MKPVGQTKKVEAREKLTPILFKADHETLEALHELEGSEEASGRRSHIIREAIKEARDRLRLKKIQDNLLASHAKGS